jgi:hypothetical protein
MWSRIVAFIIGPIGMWLAIAAIATAALAGAYTLGHVRGSNKAEVRQLERTIGELVRQREAAEAVAQSERDRAAERARQSHILRERLAEYERDEANAGTQSCPDAIGPADRDRLLRLRRR